LSLVFAGVASAHFGLKSIVVDGTTYPPFNARIDTLLGPVRRIGWTHDIVTTPFNPITSLSDPALACQPNAREPQLKAPARAGANVTLNWTPLVNMHSGPIINYLGYLPSPNTKPQDVKFFKIWERGFDVTKDKWANQIAVDNGHTFTVQLPSDIKAGTYVLRTELIALHGNMKNLNTTNLAGPQFYPYCINIEVLGSGNAQPEGVTFPGAYKLTDYGIAFSPYMTYGDVESGIEQNSKYRTPGPPLYAGKFDAPNGQPPVASETGEYTGEAKVRYQALVDKLDKSGEVLSNFVNSAWPHYKPNKTEFAKYPAMIQKASKERLDILRDIDSLLKVL